jgi:hypothetical protein
VNESDERNNWGAAKQLWAAAIIIDGQNAPDRADLRIRQVTWASREEAIGFLLRHLPKTDIPAELDHPNRRRITGEIRTAELFTMWVGSEIVEWVVCADEIDTIAYLVRPQAKMVDDGQGGSAVQTFSPSVRLLRIPPRSEATAAAAA